MNKIIVLLTLVISTASLAQDNKCDDNATGSLMQQYGQPAKKYALASLYMSGATISGLTSVGCGLLVHDNARMEVYSIKSRFQKNGLRNFLKEHSQDHYLNLTFAYFFGKKAVEFSQKALKTLED